MFKIIQYPIQAMKILSEKVKEVECWCTWLRTLFNCCIVLHAWNVLLLAVLSKSYFVFFSAIRISDIVERTKLD
jgi:hypothetical protein